MSLYPEQQLGVETHRTTDQFFHVLDGEVTVVIGSRVYELTTGDAIIVPHGMEHNVIARTDVRLYTIYSPPVHPPNRRQHVQ